MATATQIWSLPAPTMMSGYGPTISAVVGGSLDNNMTIEWMTDGQCGLRFVSVENSIRDGIGVGGANTA